MGSSRELPVRFQVIREEPVEELGIQRSPTAGTTRRATATPIADTPLGKRTV